VLYEIFKYLIQNKVNYYNHLYKYIIYKTTYCKLSVYIFGTFQLLRLHIFIHYYVGFFIEMECNIFTIHFTAKCVHVESARECQR